MNKEEFYAKLAKVEADQATPEEKAAFAAADAERAAGTYDGVEFKNFAKQGRIALRLPPSLHKELKEQAAAEQMSLNQYIVYTLGRSATSWNLKHGI